MGQQKRIAINGSGIAGLTCAHLLGPRHEVVLFEAANRLGGHSNTVEVEDPTGGPLAIDTGFIVHNDRNYPNLVRLLDELGVGTIDSEMSFAVTDRASDFTYRATSLNTLLARRSNIIDPRLWRMATDIVRFHRHGRRFLHRDDADPTMTIGDFLAAGRYSETFVELHLIPMGAAVWSADPQLFDRFPALSLLRFLDNHGLLSIGDRPQWKTIVGGSRSYVQAIADRFSGAIYLSTPVTKIDRGPTGITVHTEPDDVDPSPADHGRPNEGRADEGRAEPFDHVILATHSDQSLALLADADDEETRLLGAIGFQPNRATLHTDVSLLSPQRRAWAAWNYECGSSTATDRAAVTYDLTTLQRLVGSRRYLVSLNADDRIDPTTVLASFDYDHPVFDNAAIAAQGRLAARNGRRNTWFCGAWMGYGFHEDGMVSGLEVAKALGATW